MEGNALDLRELMRLPVEARCARDDAGRLVTVTEPGGARAPRFFLGRTAAGNLSWFRDDVDAATAAELAALAGDVDAGDAAPAGAGPAHAAPLRGFLHAAHA